MDTLPVFDTATAEPVKDDSSLRIVQPTPVLSNAQPVNTTRVAGYVVVARSGNKLNSVWYEAYEHLNDAADAYADCEYRLDTIAVGIFPCDERGMPIDKPLDPHTLTRLVRETRAA